VEQDAVPNFTLGGFALINKAKARLEDTCPGTVSCADVLVLAMRESLQLVRGPQPSRPSRTQELTAVVKSAAQRPLGLHGCGTHSLFGANVSEWCV